MNFTLVASAAQLDEIVVTALGIEKEKKALGVAQQTLDSTALTDGARTTNVVSTLSGKIAGINVTSASTQGGSARVVIRGATSIGGNNQPLFVVDGIPIDNSSYASSTLQRGYGGSGGAVDFAAEPTQRDVSRVLDWTVAHEPVDAKRVGAVGENGTAAGNSYAQTIKAGNVAEVPLGNLKDGSYTVTVNSSVPVVAAVRTSVIGQKARDFAWFASSPGLNDRQLVAVPSGPSPVLHFANAGEKDAPVTVTPETGKPFTVTVPAEGGANHAVPPGNYTIEGAKGLAASVSFAGAGLTSSFALEPPGPLAAPIEVYPR